MKVYEATHREPFSKDWGLRDQIQRAAVGIASNIAEGYERQTTKEFVQFLFIAKGSAGEVRTQLHIARALGYLSEETYAEYVDQCEHVSGLIANFIKYLRSPR